VLETCVYSHSNICNIQIYFCNIQIKHLQHKFEKYETLEIFVYNHNNICNIQMKYLKHMFETPETLENIHVQHVFIVISTYATSQIYFCNILIKHLKHKSKTSETLETRRRRGPWPTWWGTVVASKLGSRGRCSACSCLSAWPLTPPSILPRLLAAPLLLLQHRYSLGHSRPAH
jgi:hypothetical protein